MSAARKPHSVPDALATLRGFVEELDLDEERTALAYLEEQLEALREDLPTILWIIEELYNGASWRTMETLRPEVNEALARFTALASSPASKPYCACPEGAYGNPCNVCGKPEAVSSSGAHEVEIAGLREQYEAMDDALREILDVTEKWTRRMTDEERLLRIDTIAKAALPKVSTPASEPNSASRARGWRPAITASVFDDAGMDSSQQEREP